MNIEVVYFEDFAGRAPKYRITIESDGKDTKAVMEVNGRQVKDTQAKLNPKDEFNWRTGAETAFGRLWEPLFGRDRSKQPKVREVKRQAKAGEYIKITNACDEIVYKNGDVLKVTYSCELFALVECKYQSCVAHNEYVILEGYTPEKGDDA